ncbi:hypothetical protein [Paenibacillus dakarensis]|uniref:hypothetical protein n=1 Tax=Paenibacillus dakarensis TaxID=1527293 RepID=UPI0006D58A01|nr:hypothetical protein [Paenibacillus dakarensis]
MSHQRKTHNTAESRQVSKESQADSVVKKGNVTSDPHAFTAADEKFEAYGNPLMKSKDKQKTIAANLWGEVDEEEQWTKGRVETHSLFLRSYE